MKTAKEMFEDCGYQKNDVLSNNLQLVYSLYEINYEEDEYDKENGKFYRWIECHNIQFGMLFQNIRFVKSTIKIEKDTNIVLEIKGLTTGAIGESIDYEVLQAINQQVKELHWLEEK